MKIPRLNTLAVPLLIAAALLPVAAPSFAQGAAPAVNPAKPAVPPSAQTIRAQLPGEWAGSATARSGELRDTDLTYRADGTFNGETAPKDDKVLTYSGTWKLDGNRLTHNYTQISGQLPERLRLATVEVAAIDKTSLTFRSPQSGKEWVFVRTE
ncbi:hypothetical protein ACO2Q9_06895 [Variovorax sp. VNK109]|uniref:hypothetical protein n=1 Tax=Variovorax sp. VNK109 TaxID=3400919 RepID=UPI003C048B10